MQTWEDVYISEQTTAKLLPLLLQFLYVPKSLKQYLQVKAQISKRLFFLSTVWL